MKARAFNTSFGNFVFVTGNEVALITSSYTFVGQVSSKGVSAQPHRFSGMKKSEISELMTKAYEEAVK